MQRKTCKSVSGSSFPGIADIKPRFRSTSPWGQHCNPPAQAAVLILSVLSPLLPPVPIAVSTPPELSHEVSAEENILVLIVASAMSISQVSWLTNMYQALWPSLGHIRHCMILTIMTNSISSFALFLIPTVVMGLLLQCCGACLQSRLFTLRMMLSSEEWLYPFGREACSVSSCLF